VETGPGGAGQPADQDRVATPASGPE
jgi:hypothetical protein